MFPHQTDGIFQSVHMPVLQPANISEILTLGLAGFALSRFSGVWVGMKTIADVVESAATFDLADAYPAYQSPARLMSAHGLNWDPLINWPAGRAGFERRMIEERIPAVIGWAVANRIDRPVFTAWKTRIVIVTVRKAHQDLMQALSNLGVGEHEAEGLGISIYKVAMSWPLATEPLLAFVRGDEHSPDVQSHHGIGRQHPKAGPSQPMGPRPQRLAEVYGCRF